MHKSSGCCFLTLHLSQVGSILVVSHNSFKLTASSLALAMTEYLFFLTILAKVLGLAYRVHVWILTPAIVSIAMSKRFSTLLGPVSTLELVGRYRATYTIITWTERIGERCYQLKFCFQLIAGGTEDRF